MRYSKVFAQALLSAGVLFSTFTFAATVNVIGTYNDWPTEWAAMNSTNDPYDGYTAKRDFVGDTSNPCTYWANQNGYLFFRFRLDDGNPTYNDSSLFVLIDVVGKTCSYNSTTKIATLVDGDDHKVDLGFAWDNKSADVSAHGLEMIVRNTIGTNWNNCDTGDIDNDSGKKGSNDINGGGRTTDGYVRYTTEVDTVNFGTTTLIDFAVSWDYLNTYTPLTEDQTWRITLASLANSTDHNLFTKDIAGGVNSDALATAGWSDSFSPVPEPATLCLLAVGSVFVMIRRKR